MRRIPVLFLAAFLLSGCNGGHDHDHESHAGEHEHEDIHDGHVHDDHEHGTRIDSEAARLSGIETETAGPAVIRQVLVLHGTVVPDPQRVHRLHARFPGIVQEIRKQIGDTIKAGEVVAVVEANDSLQNYTITSPASGVVIAREANPGSAVEGEPILTVVDLSSVWVELAAFQHDLDRIRRGQKVTIRDVDGHIGAEGEIDSISPVGSSASQSMTVRVRLPNKQGEWRPGLFVTGEISTQEALVDLAVRRSALQTMDGSQVVFQQDGENYRARPVELGRMDRDWAEVISGLEPGVRYVVRNSFVIKADIEKSSAGHEH